jgi:hypothetical protein
VDILLLICAIITGKALNLKLNRQYMVNYRSDGYNLVYPLTLAVSNTCTIIPRIVLSIINRVR